MLWTMSLSAAISKNHIWQTSIVYVATTGILFEGGCIIMKIDMEKVQEMDNHWKEVMDLAVKYGFVCQAFAGTAISVSYTHLRHACQ